MVDGQERPRRRRHGLQYRRGGLHGGGRVRNRSIDHPQ
jgi:hypothetical protein